MRATMTAALLLLLGACATGSGSRQIGSGEWRAVNINGVPVIAGSVATLRLDDGMASGNSGCNSFSTTYRRLSRERIRFAPLTTTQATCSDEALTDQERRYRATLEAAASYSFYGDGSLSLIAGDGRAIRFRPGG